MSIETNNQSGQTETNSEIEFDIPEMNNNADTSTLNEESKGYEAESGTTEEVKAPESSSDADDGIGFNLYALTGGLFGAVAGAIRTKSIAGACTGVAGAVAASYLTSGAERSPVKHFSIGLASGLATSAVVSESLNYFNTPSDTLVDSDDAIVMTTEESEHHE